MINEKFEFEKATVKKVNNDMITLNTDIDAKYEQGYSRVVTEIGSYKVSLIKDIFSKENYNLQPDYQRRITWDTKKKSRLIESLIVNIPIPPIFLYEYDYDKYEIMDGLQRVVAIKSFYNDEFKLCGLTEWPELNGKKYSQLPEKIKEGIDRRQLQVITLLKESAPTTERADRIKRLVFERLNTGGVKLQSQEIRNAIYQGLGNDMCYELSEEKLFRTLWEIPNVLDEGMDEELTADEYIQIDDEKKRKKLERHSLYKRMYDVELVLRFFAMRYLSYFDYSLSDFLDDTLVLLNTYEEKELAQLKTLFKDTIYKAYKLFGDKAFRYFSMDKWSAPARMIYDPMMIVLSQSDIEVSEADVATNINKLIGFYSRMLEEDVELFDGKHQSKENIEKRVSALDAFIRSEII